MEEKNKLIKISDKDWHYKLIKYCWGVDPTVFRNLCPYFWLAVAAVFCCVPMSAWKLVKWVFCKMGESCSHALPAIFASFDLGAEAAYDRELRRLTKGQMYYLMHYDDKHSCHEARGIAYFNKIFKASNAAGKRYDDILYDIFEKLHVSHDEAMKYKGDYQREIAKMRKAQNKAHVRTYAPDPDARLKVRLAAEERRRRMEAFAKNISAATKKVCYAALVVSVFFLIFFVEEIVAYCIIQHLAKYGPVDWTTVGRCAGAFCVGGFAAFSMIKIVCAAVEFVDRAPGYTGAKLVFAECLKAPVKLCWFLIYSIWVALKFLVWTFLFKTVVVGVVNGFAEGFNEFGGIFADYFNASYSDYCPGIDWEDEDDVNEK